MPQMLEKATVKILWGKVAYVSSLLKIGAYHDGPPSARPTSGLAEKDDSSMPHALPAMLTSTTMLENTM
jgi:hypothetical protein